jgi:glycosyltransferase involved in cell wall biosynthesis
MLKVVFFGTHPQQYNGYSKVVYELARNIRKHNDIKFHVYGFQKFHNTENHREDIEGYEIYDAMANETENKTHGFGINEIPAKIKEIKPDICIVYNDMMIISHCIRKLVECKKEDGMSSMKIVAYIDQVYLNQKKEYIKLVNDTCDHAILFTKYWEQIIKDQGLTLPTTVLEHGFNPESLYPIPKDIARKYFSIGKDDFVLMNLNRNQPRKRWDVCLKAFAEILYRFPNDNIKLLIGTALTGAWNFIELFERELKKRDIPLEKGLKHIIVIDRPQNMNDHETNVLYNVADIGINTCDGEGFGLCNFEQAGIGIPQIVPRIGGFLDFFSDDRCELVEPKMTLYIDNSRDAVCGECQLSDYIDYVESFEKLYYNNDLREQFSKKSREYILKNYKWDVLADRLYDMVYTVVGKPKPGVKVEEIEIIQEIEEKSEVVPEEKKKKKLKKKKKTDKDSEIELLKQQIALLMAEKSK